MRLAATIILTASLAGAAWGQGQPLPPLGEPLQFDPVTGEAILPSAEPETPTATGPDGIAFTAEDLRRELTFIGEEIDRLPRQGQPSGAALPSETAGPTQGDILSRINDLEARLQGVQGEIDRLRFDIDRIAQDGGRRLSDMDFRVTLLEQADPSFVPPPQPLGDGTTDPAAPTTSPFGESEVALAEQFAFDAAIAAFDSGDNQLAREQFDAFLQVYPDGPLSNEVRLKAIEVDFREGRYGQTADAYLSLYNGAPNGPLAPDALLGLGSSLAQLGQQTAACATFDEAFNRFGLQGSGDFLQRLQQERALYRCQ